MSTNRPHKLPSESPPSKAKKNLVAASSVETLTPTPMTVEASRKHEHALSSNVLQSKSKTKKTEKETHRQDQQILQILFNFQTILPLLQHASRTSTEEEVQLDAFHKLLHQYDAQANAWTQAMTLDATQQAWVKPQLMRLLTQAGQLPQPDAFFPVLEHLPYQAPQSFEPVQPKLAYQVALAQASMPLMRAQMLADGLRTNPEQDLLDLMKMVADRCHFILTDWAPASFHTDGKQQLFHYLLSEAGKLMAQIWLKHAHPLQQQWAKKSTLEQQKWRKEHPDGMTLTPLKEEFQILFSRLQKLSKMVE